MYNLPNKIILQKGNFLSLIENSAAIVVSAQNDIKLIRQDIDNISVDGEALPIGSVEFIRKYMMLCGIPEPENISYPQGFNQYYKRNITKTYKKDVPWDVFVKPTKTKLFNGFVNKRVAVKLDTHDYYLYGTTGLPPTTEVWISELVNFLGEWRIYISDYNVIGVARYDDKDTEYDIPQLFINELETENKQKSILKYGSIDIGLLDNNTYSIVECNDAWALGLYKGSISQLDYIKMLWGRWCELTR